MKFVFISTLILASIGLILSCAPNMGHYAAVSSNGLSSNYIKQYQMLHSGNKCVQCKEIIVHTSCANNWHDTQFGCATPVVEYGLEPTGRCGQATMVCVPDPSRPQPQSVMIVALLDNSDGRFGPNAQVYAPISELGTSSASVIEPCSMESAWMHESLDDFPLANPLQIQCASNVVGYVLPTIEERYEFKQQVAQPMSPPQSMSQCCERVDSVQVSEGHLVDEDVQVIFVGTTMVPIVKERVVQKVIKEIHNYPIQKKRIIKTKRISKPTQFNHEYIERIPGTKIVPTFEERRATKIVYGTTIVPMVEESEVTEMLPALSVVVQEPEQVCCVPQSTVEKVEAQQVNGYEVVTPAPAQEENTNTPAATQEEPTMPSAPAQELNITSASTQQENTNTSAPAQKEQTTQYS